MQLFEKRKITQSKYTIIFFSNTVRKILNIEINFLIRISYPIFYDSKKNSNASAVYFKYHNIFAVDISSIFINKIQAHFCTIFHPFQLGGFLPTCKVIPHNRLKCCYPHLIEMFDLHE